ncbi:MAG: glycoside hydrolase family 9 protein [Lachnospiraceae bacterium]|nr:glycoside hydrolase family 9 protein [Lachnospiraceae bacterium]
MAIYLNQEGYLTNVKKVAVSTKACTFQVMDVSSNKSVAEGRSGAGVFDEAAGEEVFALDFSGVRKPGKYYIQGDDGTRSHTFTVGDKIYAGLHKDMIKALYFQRCGCELKAEHAGVYAHEACHIAPAILLEDYMAGTENPETYDLCGGWHDAGDFGRYSTAASVALGHLLYAYKLFPESFKDSLQIPESGNDMPDVLNECLYELAWLIKMQREDGGVYHKLTAWSHAPFIMPQEDHDPFLIYPVSSMATADYAAIMALASGIYKDFRPEFAKEALEKAKKAWNWLENNSYVGFKNPEGSNTGEYDDVCDEDERFWAACEMQKADPANAKVYLERAKVYAEKVSKVDFGWTDVSAFGSLAVLTAEEGLFPAEFVKDISNVVFAEADRLVALQNNSGYGVAMKAQDYVWGSNMVVCNRGMLLVLCALKCKDVQADVYKEAALSQLHYLLGKNALDVSYVTGHGENAYKNPHNRPTASDGIDEPMPGWVSGGPFKAPCDAVAMEKIPVGTPPMKCYIDHVDSYSTNEITIYWNSPAIFMTAFFMQGE